MLRCGTRRRLCIVMLWERLRCLKPYENMILGCIIFPRMRCLATWSSPTPAGSRKPAHITHRHHIPLRRLVRIIWFAHGSDRLIFLLRFRTAPIIMDLTSTLRNSFPAKSQIFSPTGRQNCMVLVRKSATGSMWTITIQRYSSFSIMALLGKATSLAPIMTI